MDAEAWLILTVDLLRVPKQHIDLWARLLDHIAAVRALRPSRPLVLEVQAERHGRLLQLRLEQLHVAVRILALLGQGCQYDVLLDDPLDGVALVNQCARLHIDLPTDAFIKLVAHLENLLLRLVLRRRPVNLIRRCLVIKLGFRAEALEVWSRQLRLQRFIDYLVVHIHKALCEVGRNGAQSSIAHRAPVYIILHPDLLLECLNVHLDIAEVRIAILLSRVDIEKLLELRMQPLSRLN